MEVITIPARQVALYGLRQALLRRPWQCQCGRYYSLRDEAEACQNCAASLKRVPTKVFYVDANGVEYAEDHLAVQMGVLTPLLREAGSCRLAPQQEPGLVLKNVVEDFEALLTFTPTADSGLAITRSVTDQKGSLAFALNQAGARQLLDWLLKRPSDIGMFAQCLIPVASDDPADVLTCYPPEYGTMVTQLRLCYGGEGVSLIFLNRLQREALIDLLGPMLLPEQGQ